jgi:hypothetical protein
LVQEEVVDRQVVASGGFHHEQRGVTDVFVGDERRESLEIEVHGSLSSNPLSSQNTECGGCTRNIQCYDMHKKTSLALRNRSHFPVSRLKEAHRLNQPIGKIGTEDRLLLKFKDLNKDWSSVPEVYHQISINNLEYRLNYY